MIPVAEATRPERTAATPLRVLREGMAGEPRMALAPQAVPAAVSPPPDTRGADHLAETMRLVKAARFNAAARLERKQSVSLFTQSMVALYFVGLAVFQAVYVGQIPEATDRLITFIQLVSSVFTLMLGLLEAMNDYKMKAHHLQNCALAVAELAQELRIARPTDIETVQSFRRRYNEALRICPVNHARLDYLYAKLGSKASPLTRAGLALRNALDVYGLYALFLAVPPLIWWLHQ